MTSSMGRPAGSTNTPQAPRPDFIDNPDRGCAPRHRHNPLLWTSEEQVLKDEAKRICRGCPVRAYCLRYALDQDERLNIWGGVDMSITADRNRANRGEKQFDDLVHELWQQRHSDSQIARQLRVDPSTVRTSRNRQHLAPRYGARGIPLEVAA